MPLPFLDLYKRSPKTVRRATLILGTSVVVLLALIVLLMMQIQAYRSPQISAEEKVKRLTAEIGKSVVLPDDEIPTVATVADPERLRNEQFFMNAKIGDQVLLYTKAKRAVLWRPSEHKVVEISSLDVALPQTSGETE